MTKANITLIKEFGEEPIALYYLYRGENYERLKEALVSYLSAESLDEVTFQSWVYESFSTLEAGLAEAIWVKGAYIYFDNRGRRSEVSIVFDATAGEVLVYKWEKAVFRGSPTRLLALLTGKG